MSSAGEVREAQVWNEKRADYYLQSGSSFQNPYGIPLDELVAMCVTQPSELSAQTVFGRYVPASGLVFSSQLILNLFAQGSVVRGNEWADDVTRAEYLEHVAHGHSQVHRFKAGSDLARKKDSTTIYVLDTLPLHHGGKARLVYYRKVTRVPWDVVYSEIGKAAWMWGAEFKVDSTGAGDVVLSELQSRRYCPVHDTTNVGNARCADEHGEHRLGCDPDIYHRIDVSGFEFSQRSKVQLITHLAQCLGYGYDEELPDREFGRIVVPPIPALRVQLAGYMWDDKKLDTDDVMGLALAAWLGVKGTPGQIASGSPHRR